MRDQEPRHQLTCLVKQPPWAGDRYDPLPMTVIPPATMRSHWGRSGVHAAIAGLLLALLNGAPAFSSGLRSPSDAVSLHLDRMPITIAVVTAKTPAAPTRANVPPSPRPPDGSESRLNTQEPPPELDLDTLEQRLRDTDAIGFFTKLQLRSEINALLDAFRAYHRGKRTATREELWEDYYLLLFRVITLLQDGDPELAQEIYAAREALWEVLLNPETFEKS